ncbi:MAG: hypothetical protein HQL15_09130 [Candidatus Omnitrophica bacterium]|nr:hypothetical protein [Candidatus Omnitrophota bacterium]
MKRNFHYLILATTAILLTGCSTTKYAFDQTFGDQREYGAFQAKLTKPQPNDDLLLARADQWVKQHLW